MSKKPFRPTLCLDFDGVIHSYTSGWKGASVIPDMSVPGVGDFLLRAVAHWNVAIYSSRSRFLFGRMAMKRYVRDIIWDACLKAPADLEAAWSATEGLPPDWMPWSLYDVRDAADHINRHISYPWFKPAALVTIDDRALTFNGDWFSYDPVKLKEFRPWNKKASSPSDGSTMDANPGAAPTRTSRTAST